MVFRGAPDELDLGKQGGSDQPAGYVSRFAERDVLRLT